MIKVRKVEWSRGYEKRENSCRQSYMRNKVGNEMEELMQCLPLQRHEGCLEGVPYRLSVDMYGNAEGPPSAVFN
jgi:hypothetical protein